MDRVAVPHGPIWHGATVLLIDNESTMRTLLRRRLEAENFHVEEAEDGESALAIVQARTEPFDLVLTDLSMVAHADYTGMEHGRPGAIPRRGGPHCRGRLEP